MEIEPWDPWDAIEKVRRRSNRIWTELFDQLRGHLQKDLGFLPEADLIETANDYRLYVFVPGVIEEDIDISLRSRELTVRGERFCPHDEDTAADSTIECRYGFFERRFQFSQQVGSFNAKYEDGVLTIIVRKGGANG